MDHAPLYLHASRGLCRECGNARLVEVRYVSDGQRVFLERLCPEHGRSRALVAESLAWLLEAQQLPPAPRPPERVLPRSGHQCPSACGPCELHGQRCTLPVFSITNACNLRCPICFTYNRADAIYHMPVDELRRQLDFVVEATGGVDLINITGGEPTLHPELCELVAAARRPGIGRVTVNSNGLTLAERPELCQQLGELGAYVILSLDTLDPGRSVRLHGRDLVAVKQRALDNLEKAGVQTTLLMVLVGGVNEDELGSMVELALVRDFVRSLTIQTMTYTGQGGGGFAPSAGLREHLPVDGVERRIAEATGGRLRRADFLPLPTAHPLCYGVSYLLIDERGTPHSFARLLGRESLARHLADGYLLHPGDQLEEEIRRGVDRLWSEGAEPGLLAAVKSLLRELFPPGQTLSVHERQRRAEQRVKTIYVHAHMDEDTYEVGRAMRCPDQVPVDASRLIGACNYNLFYRMKDPRFWIEP
jgi:7,8-dihydro-6-hydroxymethylpterin dimethyltransferase